MNGSIRTTRVAFAAGLLVCLAQAASGQKQMPNMVSQLDPAWDRLAANNAKFLTPDQQTLLDDLAFAVAVAAGGCRDFQLDKQKVEQAFKDFKTDDYMKLPADAKRKREYHLMMNYGATVALYNAEGLLHPKEACRFAETKRAAGPGRFWLPVAGE